MTGVLKPSVWDIDTVSTVQRYCYSAHCDFGSLCTQNGTVIFLFYCDKTFESNSEWGD